ncbi:MAG: hypothetical protein ABIV48_00265 [Pyrinomonadaceae bacterium]
MSARKQLFAAFLILLIASALMPPAVNAQKNEFDAIAAHIKTKYHAKKVGVPFMWLAKLAVKVVRPAGVKSFNVTLFEDLKFSVDSIDTEMQSAMRNSFGPQWSSVLRVRSKYGEQAYIYMREDGKNVKLAIVTINKQEAALVRATISPEKLVEFIDNPKILGISLGDNLQTKKKISEQSEDGEVSEKTDQ